MTQVVQRDLTLDNVSWFCAERTTRWLVFFRGFRDPAEFEPDRPKKTEEYRVYAAGLFAGDMAKGGQGVEII